MSYKAGVMDSTNTDTDTATIDAVDRAPLWLHGEMSHRVSESLVLTARDDDGRPVDGSWLVRKSPGYVELEPSFVLTVAVVRGKEDPSVSHHHIDVMAGCALTQAQVHFDGAPLRGVSTLVQLLTAFRDCPESETPGLRLGRYVRPRRRGRRRRRPS